MFYKFINESTIEKAPRPLKIENKDVFTNSEAIHNEQGYYRLITAEYPQDENCYESNYYLKDNIIYRVWIPTDKVLISE